MEVVQYIFIGFSVLIGIWTIYQIGYMSGRHKQNMKLLTALKDYPLQSVELDKRNSVLVILNYLEKIMEEQ